ncbi:hypothetical protein R1sor_006493 [Riccia sorocarpa]|uniref:RING-type domain-containing protein n=1 Tax=Riccia sorocarpa TaxID=122646 RepID=A0ABD3HQK8_9MARC
MFLSYARFLSPTEDDADASDFSRYSVILTRRNVVLYSPFERRAHLEGCFRGWNCTPVAQGGTEKVPKQFRGGERCSICMDMIGPSGAYLIATYPHIFHIECLVMTLRGGEDKCPNCRNPFHRDMIRKFYMERVQKFVHPTSYFEDPTAQRRTNLILPFLYRCFERYLIAFETSVPLEQHWEMLPSFIAEVDADFSTRTWPLECWNSRVIERNLAVVYGGRGTTVPPNARFQILG